MLFIAHTKHIYAFYGLPSSFKSNLKLLKSDQSVKDKPSKHGLSKPQVKYYPSKILFN